MTESPDFRSERSDSPEGRGIAYGRWALYWSSVPDSVLANAFDLDPDRDPDVPARGYPEFLRDQIAEAVVEQAELIGFWVAWHRAGGFAQLETGGWHRATIFRKIRRFRARYGVHPDEFRFDWIKLDLKRAWDNELTRHLSDDPDYDPEFE
jgi:hypothetical protein